MNYVVNLQNSAHPLKGFLLGAVGSLFCDDDYPLFPEDGSGEDGDPASVNELHGFDCEDRGDDVVRVVTTTA